MQQKNTSRILIILGVLAVALFMIFPQPKKLFDPNLRFWEKTALKPGIDMVGGTSLTYEIRPAAGTPASQELVTQTMSALKRRLDPDGTKNLIWRPQGVNRLEIQMPLSDYSGSAKLIRQKFAAAQRAVEATNVRAADVIAAIETLQGDARQARLAELAKDSESRGKLYGALRGKFDQAKDARDKGDTAAAAQAEIEYEDLQKNLGGDTINLATLQADLAIGGTTRTERLAKLREANKDFPSRLAAIDNYAAEFDGYQKVKGTLDDSADLKRQLKGSGVLEFHIMVDTDSAPRTQIEDMLERLAKEGPVLRAGDTMRWFAFDRPDSGGSGVITGSYNDKRWGLAWITPNNSMVNTGNDDRWVLESSYPTSDSLGARAVGFRFDMRGAAKFTQLTRAENKGKTLGAILDGKIISAANLQATIGREGQITLGKDAKQEEFSYLINTLNAGSLPAQLDEDPISERTVGPQLGLDNLKDGLFACGLGLVIVLIFLVSYYYLAGVVAFIAVAMNVVLILGVMAGFGATFTLPGVAGIVLTIGASVDANVLIFERLREEQQRGLSLKLALQHAYDRAFSAIVDSNATTVITSLVLIWMSSEEVKGFGVTLLIGLIASLFTSLYVTKTIFSILVDKVGIKTLGSFPLSVPAWNDLLHPKIDWMSKAWIFVVSGAVIIILGLGAFVYEYKQGRLLDIEFASGTAVQFELKDGVKMSVSEVRDALANQPELPAVGVVSIGADEKTYEVVTPNPAAAKVRDAILAVVGDKLNVVRPSTFTHAGQELDTVMETSVVPIGAGDFNVNGFKPVNTGKFRGGAAIVLTGISPPLAPSDIDARIKAQQLSPLAGQASVVYSDFAVESPRGNDLPSDTAIVLVADPAFPHDQDVAKWRDNLVAPNWKLINEAITRPPTLQKVTNFDASVAGDAQRSAIVALVLSLVVIMAYIWLRFGNLKYGTATVVAMLHDTLLVVGAVGLSHIIAGTAIGKLLLIHEGFRINLTLVAAILTVMSYSMIDTIVVFDRIRENRGKYGSLNKRIINDSINQTMSRTLLTAGTTVVTLIGMYISGGAAIHGFTFVLLIGILVGTYSSIVIAAPILLWGGHEEGKIAG